MFFSDLGDLRAERAQRGACEPNVGGVSLCPFLSGLVCAHSKESSYA